jgi:hypothetical protein
MLTIVTTMTEAAKRLLDDNPSTKWESDGRRGEHWVQIVVPRAKTICAVDFFLSEVRMTLCATYNLACDARPVHDPCDVQTRDVFTSKPPCVVT